MHLLFINGSTNKNGNTAALAKELIGGREAETLHLTDYRINVYGQELEEDEFQKVLTRIRQADVLIIGAPLYWHNLCGSVRTLLDRFYGPVEQGSLSGRKLFFLYQGAAPEKWMMEAGEFTIERFAKLYGMEYMGMASNKKEAALLSEKLG